MVLWNKQEFHGDAVSKQQSTTLKSKQKLDDLLRLPAIELERCDIALMNLLCAQGLPGAEHTNITDYLATLDQWAGRIKSETERNFHRFRDKPNEYYNSEGYFRMLIMSVVMYEDFGIRYNPNRIVMPQNIDANDHFFADSRDIFIHGLAGDRHMGTCSSMPVLYIAIGRRLGYPLKLVTTKSHLFVRWQSNTDYFDVEATGKGMNRYDDEHFKHWPFPVSDEEVRTEGYLKSLTTSEELAVFISLRGNCLKEAGRVTEAASCYTTALRLAPGWNAYRVLLANTQGSSVANGNRIQRSPVPESVPYPDNNPVGQPAGIADPNPLQNIR